MNWRFELFAASLRLKKWNYYLAIILEPLDLRLGVGLNLTNRQDVESYNRFPVQQLYFHIPTIRIEFFWVRVDDINAAMSKLP